MRDRFDKEMAERFGKNQGVGNFMTGLLTGLDLLGGLR